MPRQQIGAPIRFDPDCVRHYLDVLHPALPRELERPRPAGRNIPQSFRQPARVGSAWARIYGRGAPGRCSIACCGKNNQFTGTGEITATSCGSTASWCSTENAMNKGDSSAAARQIYKAHSIHR